MPTGEETTTGGEVVVPPPAGAVASPRAASSSRSSGNDAASPAQPAAGGAHRKRRSSSVVVYPENGDAGKPKVFARQSFVVSGEEEEMAETILQARELAGQRRRSTFNAEKQKGKEGEIKAVAQNLADRRESLAQPVASDPVAGTPAATAATPPAAKASETEQSDADAAAAAAKRRSSVMKLPDNLRALVQQSDAKGVQQKTASPYIPQGQAGGGKDTAAAAADTATGTSSLNNTGSSTASSTGGGQGHGWMANVLAFIRWKKLPRRKSKGHGGGEGKGGKGAGRNGGATPGVSPTPAGGFGRKPPALLPKQSPEFAGRKQLVLDLDETLVHSSFKPVPGADFIMDILVDGTFHKVFVRKRPGVDEFLERVAKKYELIIFTASKPQYANPLLDLLDPKGLITSRLFREHCTFHEGYFVKDLTLLRHQSLESTIIVDNSPMAYMFQPENAIDCMSWIDERDDNELEVIADFLEAIVDVPDVRDLLEFWREGEAVLDSVC